MAGTFVNINHLIRRVFIYRNMVVRTLQRLHNESFKHEPSRSFKFNERRETRKNDKGIYTPDVFISLFFLCLCLDSSLNKNSIYYHYYDFYYVNIYVSYL